jgi:hypothetical protein
MKKLALARPPELKEIARRAATLGWHFTDEFPADSDCPYEAVWTLPSGAEVHYIVDDIAGTSFFTFRSDASPELEAILVKRFACRSLEQALASAEQATDPARQTEAAAMIAVLGPEGFEPRCHAAIARLMSTADPRVRLRAVVAAAALGWREFVPQIKDIAANDTTDYVRWRAKDVLEAFSRSGL